MTSNDLTAIGALRAIAAAGLDVPRDISVVGFDDIELSQYTHPPLSTIRLSREELGRKAFDALYPRGRRVGCHGTRDSDQHHAGAPGLHQPRTTEEV